MLKSYLKVAGRNFLKYKGYSFINVAGLALGLACCILILLYVQDQLSYDRFHKNAARIYRLVVDENDAGRVRHLASSYIPLAPAMQADFPEIAHAVRILPRSVTVARGREKVFQEERFFLVDEQFFEVFSFASQQGTLTHPLDDPMGLVITAATAQKYFGDENPMGKTLTVENRHDFKVAGVMDNLPGNAHFDFDFLANFRHVDTLVGRGLLSDTHQSWHWPPIYTYLLLPPQYSADALQSRLPDFVRRHMPERMAAQRSVHLQPLTEIHLHSNRENEIAPATVGSIAYVRLFSAIAAFILLIACINFMNLATARAAHRAKEIGLRKVIGAQRSQLVRQFLGEALFYTLLAMCLALALVELLLPSFNALVGKQIQMRYEGNWRALLGLPAFAVFVAVLAGGYPAFFLARFRPVQALQGKSLHGRAPHAPLRLRAILVVLQFVVSIVLLIVTAVVNEQLHFIQSRRLGFEKEHLVVIPIRDEALQENFPAVQNALRSQAGVAHVTAISNFPWERGYYDFRIHAEGMPPGEQVNLPTLLVEHDFIQTFNMEIVAGRAFSQAYATDAEQAFILNEAAVQKLGWDSAVHKKIVMSDVARGEPRQGRVIGVVKDFHLRSLHHQVEPLILLISPASYYIDNLAVRIKAQNLAPALAGLAQIWRELAPHRPFEYFFVDQVFDELYRNEQKLAQLFQYFSVLAVVIGGLGLFGLASFVAQQKTKEIGIRKVLGASVAGLVALLSKDLIKLVLAANLIAWPVAYAGMSGWLQGFAYRISLEARTFLWAGALALALALLTVSYQAVKAALANPVDSLRYE